MLDNIPVLLTFVTGSYKIVACEWDKGRVFRLTEFRDGVQRLNCVGDIGFCKLDSSEQNPDANFVESFGGIGRESFPDTFSGFCFPCFQTELCGVEEAFRNSRIGRPAVCDVQVELNGRFFLSRRLFQLSTLE